MINIILISKSYMKIFIYSKTPLLSPSYELPKCGLISEAVLILNKYNIMR